MDIANTSGDADVLAEIGRRLRRVRLDRNLSQAALAEEAGVGRMTLQRIEEGQSASMTSLARILRALDLLEGLNQLIPEQEPSPIEELERRGRERKRAGGHRSTKNEPAPGPWRWGDEDPERN